MSEIWVLIDERIGNSNQAIALAEILGQSYEKKFLKYNCFAKLPSFLKKGFIDLRQESVDNLLLGAPRLIISCGRRAARIATELKYKNINCKSITILKPDINLDNFDLVILPNHDKNKDNSKKDNVFFVNGAVVFSEDKKKDDLNVFPEYANLDKPVVVGLLGGKSHSCNIEKSEMKEFMDLLIESCKKLNATLLFSNSRRTGQKNTEYIKGILKNSNINYHFYDVFSGELNPYRKFLEIADFIVITGDSVSMCSEAIAMKKPTYIYHKKNMLSHKHQKFIAGLIDDKFAKSFNSSKLEIFNIQDFNKASLLRERIRNIIQISCKC